MRITTGIDIIENERIERAINRLGNKFLETIYTKNEIEYCESKGKMKYQSYAARFAGKEATFKALMPFLKNKYDITWKDVEIINDKNGKPVIKFLKHNFSSIISIDISLSHCKKYATANVVAIYE